MIGMEDKLLDVVVKYGIERFGDIEPYDYFCSIRRYYLDMAKDLMRAKNDRDREFGEYLCGLAEKLQDVIEAL